MQMTADDASDMHAKDCCIRFWIAYFLLLNKGAIQLILYTFSNT